MVIYHKCLTYGFLYSENKLLSAIIVTYWAESTPLYMYFVIIYFPSPYKHTHTYIIFSIDMVEEMSDYWEGSTSEFREATPLDDKSIISEDMLHHYSPVLSAMTVLLDVSLHDGLLNILGSMESFSNLTTNMDSMVQFSVARLLKQYTASHEPIFKSSIRYKIDESSLQDETILEIQKIIAESLTTLKVFRDSLDLLYNSTMKLISLVT